MSDPLVGKIANRGTASNTFTMILCVLLISNTCFTRRPSLEKEEVLPKFDVTKLLTLQDFERNGCYGQHKKVNIK